MLARAKEQNVKKIICIGTSHQDSLAARDFATEDNGVYWAYGIHPNEATGGFRFDRDAAERELECSPDRDGSKRDNLVAIGEVGLDYHYEGYDRDAQIRLFEEMLQLAADKDLPISFHVREAFNDFFAITKNFPRLRGVVHSFTDSKKTLKRILTETEFYIGVNGLATYSTLPTPPLERTLLETDAPFLAPVPHRGDTNEPSFIPEIANWLANKLEQNPETVAKITTKNATDLFDL